jgi:hypothetical protein
LGHCTIANKATLNGAIDRASVKGGSVAIIAFLAGSFDEVATHFLTLSTVAPCIPLDTFALVVCDAPFQGVGVVRTGITDSRPKACFVLASSTQRAIAAIRAC